DRRQPQPDRRWKRNGREIRALSRTSRADDHERARDRHRRREPSRRRGRARRDGRRARQRSRRDLSARAHVARGRDRAARCARLRVRAGRRGAEAVLPAAQSHHRGPHARHARRRGNSAQRLADHGAPRARLRTRSVRDPRLDPQSARARLSLLDPPRREARRGSGRRLGRARASTRRRRHRARSRTARRSSGRSAGDERSQLRKVVECARFFANSDRRLEHEDRFDDGGAFLHAPAAGARGASRGAAWRSIFAPGQEELMKETVLDVLMYLFESYVDSPDEPEPNRHERELDWLDGLNSTDAGNAPQNTAFRVFDSVEQERLDSASRGYLLHLEQIGILKAGQREIVIDRLLALDNEEIDVEQTKWVVMMVLFSQPGQQDAFAQMEDLVYADDSAWVH